MKVNATYNGEVALREDVVEEILIMKNGDVIVSSEEKVETLFKNACVEMMGRGFSLATSEKISDTCIVATYEAPKQ